MKTITVAGVKLTPAGYKYPDSKKVNEVAGPSPDNGIDYPTLYASGKNLPAIKGLEAGKEMIMIAKVKVTSYTERNDTREDGTKEETCNADFKILAAGFKPVPTKNAEEMSEDETEEALRSGDYKEED